MLGQQTSSVHTTWGNHTPTRHNQRLSKYTQSQHDLSPGRSTTRNCTSRPTQRAAQPYHITKSIPRSHLEFDLRRTYTTLGSASRRCLHIVPAGAQPGTAHIGPRTGQHSGSDLCRTHTTLGSASTRRAHIVPAGAQPGTAHIGPRTGQHSRTT